MGHIYSDTAMNTPETFQLSHRDCDALRETLDAKRREAISEKEYAACAAYEHAIRLLHESRIAAFRRRSDKRREKRRQALDSRACKDG